jgi:hypothetical protein
MGWKYPKIKNSSTNASEFAPKIPYLLLLAPSTISNPFSPIVILSKKNK